MSATNTPEKFAISKIASAQVNKCWDQVEKAICGVFAVVVENKRGEKIQLQNQMTWYTLVFQACNPQGSGGIGSSCQGSNSHHAAQIIYERAIELVASLCPVLASSLSTSAGHELLKQLSQTYTNYRTFVKFLGSVLSFLPKVLTAAQGLEKTLLLLYKDRVFKSVMSTNLRNAFLLEVEKVRRGEKVDYEMARGVVIQCMEFQVYTDELEEPLLKGSEAYFTEESQRQSPKFFMEFAELILSKETILCEKILSTATGPKLLAKFDATILEKHYPKVLHHHECGLRALMEDNKWLDASRMYRMLRRLEKGCDQMADIFASVISNHGAALNQLLMSGEEDTKYKTFVMECLNLHDKYIGILKDYLDNHTSFSKAIKRAFETFFNEKVRLSTTNAKTGEIEAVDIYQCEQLVLFIDAMLRHDSSISITSADDEAELMEKCKALFACVHNKDMFQEMYKHKMAKRLLAQNSSDDSERAMLSRLQSEMGQSYTHHLESMLKDLGVGRDLQSGFEKTEEFSKLPAELHTQVLTCAHWPLFKVEKLIVPTTLRYCLSSFEAFYKKYSTAHEVRKLTWIFALGSAHVMATFAKSQKELVLTTHQALILLYVEANPQKTVQEIAEGLGMEVSRLKPHLASLCMQKAYAVLTKSGDAGSKSSFGENDTLSYNDDFTYKLRKFKIPPPADTTDRKHVIGKTIDNRQYIVEACIVRVMKSRKEMKFQALVSEVTDQLSRLFTQDVKFIKTRIGELVVRGYLERDETDLNLFRYLTH